MFFDAGILGGTLVTADGRGPVDIGIRDGRVAALAGRGQIPSDQLGQVFDVTGMFVLPGLIDAHVHLREPGWPELEDFETGTCAAAAGGVTTFLEMPSSVPPVDSADALTRRLDAVRQRAIVDFALFGGLGKGNPGAAAQMAEVGAIAFKTYRSQPPPFGDKAKLESGMRAPDPGDMLERFRDSASTGLPHAVHVEYDPLVQYFTGIARSKGLTRPEHHNLGRPEICEVISTAETIALAQEAGARLHLVHMSSAQAVGLAARAKSDGVNVTVETCPQYLVLSSADMPRFGHFGKIHPPLRSPETRDRLWEFVKDGTIDIIATDHAPYSAEEKRKQSSIWDGPAGAPGLETLLPTLLIEVNAGRLSLETLVQLTSTRPAQIFGLHPRKGTLRPGADADLVVVDMTKSQRLRAQQFFTKGRESAVWFDGIEVPGVPVLTMVRGTAVFERGKILGHLGHGQFVTPIRSPATQLIRAAAKTG